MTALNTPSQVKPEATFDVYVKSFSGSGTPDVGGSLDSASKGENGWRYDGALRVGRVYLSAWPKSSIAGMDVVPLGGTIDPFEFGIFTYEVDDQVRIVMQPSTAGTSQGPDPNLNGQEDTGIVIFDGTVQRAGFNVKGATDTASEFERFNLVAVDAPSIDNARPEHVIRGRFYAEDPSSDPVTPVLLDGLSVPCVFNRGELPNMLPNATVSVGGGDLTITSNLFTDDNGIVAEYWTLKEALKHLITCWLMGIDETSGGDAQGDLDRSATIEPETYDALFAAPADGNDARWAGLDDLLIETDVQGLGIYDAIDRVCRAGGYRCAVLPPLGTPLAEGGVVDRQYLLRIWRAGAGPLNELRLQAREFVTDGQSAEDLLANNNVSALSGLRDTTGVRNTITAIGRTLVETTVELKPMFKPSDIADPAGAALSVREQGTPVDQAFDPYHNRHVAKGADYDAYRHVGRMWGIDETGAYEANSLGYSTGDYAHPEGGFDWLAHLGIDGNDAFTAARTANGVTDAVRSSKRARPALKLSRPEAHAIGQPFKLEVSEDGGASWNQIPHAAASLLTDRFGIMLKADNLLNVNRENAGEATKNKTPLVGDSWWGLLTGGTNLRFRLTCLVEMDFAARYDAVIDEGAATRTPAAEIIETGIIEVWQSPSSNIGDASWKRLDDRTVAASAVGADRTNNLKDLAERVRDVKGQMRYSITASNWLMDPSLFAIGDVIQGVAGRDVDFGLFNANTGERRYPSVVSMTIDAYPAQNITLDIGDEAARRGV